MDGDWCCHTSIITLFPSYRANVALTLRLLIASDDVGVGGRILREHGCVPLIAGSVESVEEFRVGRFSVSSFEGIVGQMKEITMVAEPEELPIALT